MININWTIRTGYEKSNEIQIERYKYFFMMDRRDGMYQIGFYVGGACLWLRRLASEADAKEYVTIFINRFEKIMTEKAEAYV